MTTRRNSSTDLPLCKLWFLHTRSSYSTMEGDVVCRRGNEGRTTNTVGPVGRTGREGVGSVYDTVTTQEKLCRRIVQGVGGLPSRATW